MTQTETQTVASTPSARQTWIRVATTPVFMGAALFLPAGRIDWISGWVYIALVMVMQLRVILPLQRKAPDLLAERKRIQKGTKTWDKVIAPLIALVVPLVTWVVAGLDVRHGWMAPFSPAWQAGGLVLAVASAELAARAMEANRFFSATVRIQTDRGHSVVSTGPYAMVRHPGYVGMLGFAIGTPLVLGSAAAMIPEAVCVALLLVRTSLEDRTLQGELAGYREYAERVRYRLLPPIW